MKLLNFGSMNIDKVYTVDHFVRSGETLSSLQMETFPGGKGLNQSVALARAGAEVYHAGKIGPDGDFLVKLLNSCGVRTEFIFSDAPVTGHAIIQIDRNGQNCILLYGGANKEITEEEIDRVLSHFNQDDFLIMQNEISNLPYLMKQAKKTGMKLIWNPSPIDAGIREIDFSCIDLLVVNEIEGCEITGETDPQKILDRLLSRYPAMKVLLTLGAEGSIYRDATSMVTQGIYPVKTIDTTGAGDTFLGYFIADLTKGTPVKEALELASYASALAVSARGASSSIPLRSEVLTLKEQKLR